VHVAALGVRAAAPTAAPWHPQERCKLLQLPGEDFRTLKLKRQRDRRQERALAPAATTPGMPGCTGALPCRDQSPVASSIAWASGLPPGLPASRQCALRQAPPASGVARGLQPRPASASLGRYAEVQHSPTRQLWHSPHQPCLAHRRALPSQPAVCDGSESRAAQHVVAAAAQLAAAQHARAGCHPRARRRAARLLRPSMRRAARGGGWG
jgi:hypothetical protein